MIVSMTGYGKALVKADHFIVEAEIKSLNSRYLDLSVRLPRDLSSKEFEIRDIIRKNVKRGKVTLSLFLTTESGEDKFITFDDKGLKTAIGFLEKIKSESKSSEDIKIEHILGMQELFFSNEIPDVDDQFHFIEEAVSKAIAEMNDMRRKEGSELQKDLLYRLDLIDDYLAKIEAANRSSIEEYFDKVKERATQLLETFTENKDRLETELALLVERYDVTEECVRLRSHIKMFGDTLKNSEEAGKRLNFICQEMNREANTINSKTVSADISHNGLFIKEELEKIREQIQNIE